MIIRNFVRVAILAIAATGVAACSGLGTLPTAKLSAKDTTTEYRIGSDDSLQIFIWRNPELSTAVSVRPDGKITIPLIEDLPATGKTPTELARDIEKKLATYIQDPIVTVIMQAFVGPFQDRVRIVGEAAQPQALPYRSTMTLLDVMIQVGGITDFAAGNRATVTRLVNGKQRSYRLLLDDLLRDGNMSANVKIQPGDLIVIPEAWF
jgi:polysaccharide export outer membrane protein